MSLLASLLAEALGKGLSKALAGILETLATILALATKVLALALWDLGCNWAFHHLASSLCRSSTLHCHWSLCRALPCIFPLAIGLVPCSLHTKATNCGSIWVLDTDLVGLLTHVNMQ